MRGKPTVEVAASTVFLFLALVFPLVPLLHSTNLIHLATGHSTGYAKVLTYEIIRCFVHKMYRGQQFSCKYISLSLCIYVIRDSLARSLMSVSYSVFSVKYIVPKLVRHDCSSPVRALAGCIIYRLFYPNHVFNGDCFCRSPH